MMTSKMEIQQLIVQLKERSYPILVGYDLSSAISQKLSELKSESKDIVAITDEKCAELLASFLKTVFKAIPLLVLPTGETTKSIHYLEKVYCFLAKNRIDRKGGLFVIGGGVIGDLGGFAAASFLRGIDFYALPTTLLAMVDSSVGGKTGVNLPEGKNLVGSFYQPRGIFAATSLLKTLPSNEFAAGMAEVIKYGLLADASLFNDLKNEAALTPEHPDLISVIQRCCKIKADIVQADEKETASSGGRALLNLGHTFAHAIEKVAGYGAYLHGEAVSIGLVLAAQFSQDLGYVNEDTVESVKDVLKKYHLPIVLRTPLPVTDLIEAILHDKKVQSGKVRFVVLKSIGQAVTTATIDPKVIIPLWLKNGASEGTLSNEL